MKILVTGACRFIGKNLITELNNEGYHDIYQCDRHTTKDELEEYTKDCEFIFHLAGAEETEKESEYKNINVDFTDELMQLLRKHDNKATILYASSIYFENRKSYSQSKLFAENLIKEHCKVMNSECFIYKLPMVFGKWSEPSTAALVSYYSYHIAKHLEYELIDENKEFEICYVDDVFLEFIQAVEGKIDPKKEYYDIPIIYHICVNDLIVQLQAFHDSRKNLSIPTIEGTLSRKLYSTYLTYVDSNEFCYDLVTHADNRGSLTEIFKGSSIGQISINVSKPGVSKGDHWHHTKCEKFVVLSGEGLIRFRKLDTENYIDYYVSGEKLQVVDVPVGYIHSVINVGTTDLITLMWYSEPYNPANKDTYIEKL